MAGLVEIIKDTTNNLYFKQGIHFVNIGLNVVNVVTNTYDYLSQLSERPDLIDFSYNLLKWYPSLTYLVNSIQVIPDDRKSFFYKELFKFNILEVIIKVMHKWQN